MGGVSNLQMYVDAAARMFTSYVDMSATYTPLGGPVLYDPTREIVIESVSISYAVTMSAGTVPQIDFGTVADPDAVMSITPTNSATLGAAGEVDTTDGASDTFTNATVVFGTTYDSAANDRTRGRQVIPANTPIYMTHVGGTDTGEITIHIKAYYKDTPALK